MAWEKATNIFQLIGALLGIPAAAAGAYAVYRSHFSADVACQGLRTTILLAIDKNLPAEAKRTLLQKDVGQFANSCASLDPDAHAIFQSVLRETENPRPAPGQPPRTAAAAASAPAMAARQGMPTVPAGSFGTAASGERRGWVALDRRDAGHMGEPGFGGYTAGSLPSAGAVLSALWMAPVWYEPPMSATFDVTKVQGRLAIGGCVQVLTARTAGSGRPWAEVQPADCPAAAR